MDIGGLTSYLGKQSAATIRWIGENIFSWFALARLVAIFMLAGLLLHVTEFIRLPFFPFTTLGAIYIDSPEIYTRERLVNDRYDQDHWLRAQLDMLDTSENLLTATLFQRVGIGIGSGDGGMDSAQLPRPKQTSQGGLPFDQEFRIRAAVRDTIRQLILENMLDDRHDLTGNSVYGLKFDTSVIPGTNTHQRAFVRISLTIDPLFSGGNSGQYPTLIPPHVAEYFQTELSSIDRDKDNALYKPYQLYKKWLENIKYRLNGYVSDYCEVAGTHEANNAELSWHAMEVVLGIDRQQAVQQDSGQTRLLEPWSRFLRITQSGGNNCGNRPWFEVSQVWDTVVLFQAEKGQLPVPAWAKDSYFMVDKTNSGTALTVFNHFGGSDLNPKQYDILKLNYPVSSELVDWVRKNNKIHPICENGVTPVDQCDNLLKRLTIPAGFFNFMEAIIKTDAYTYAIFPKNDVTGILRDSTVIAELLNGTSGENRPSMRMDLIRGLRKSSTSSVLVGYGDGASLHEGKVEFGWMTSGWDNMEPLQKTQLALVSVPAWTSELQLEVFTGWLDRNSNEESLPSIRMSVPVPPDYEAFDSFVGGNQVRRQPKILDDFMEKHLAIDACQGAQLLIPGFRLWRSSTVTLGSQKADRIAVLPNMRGIIADFERVEIPSNVPDGASNVVNVKLRVWTSEGADAVKGGVDVRIPESGRCVQKLRNNSALGVAAIAD